MYLFHIYVCVCVYVHVCMHGRVFVWMDNENKAMDFKVNKDQYMIEIQEKKWKGEMMQSY